MDNIIEVKNLVKKYNSFTAVNDISFVVSKGEIIGLLGPNGAGKTTIINMILGILEPTSGGVKILGKDSIKDRAEISKNINFSAVYAHLPLNLTVYQNLYIFGLIYEVENLKTRIEELLREFDLKKFRNSKAGLLSSGELSRLNFAKAIINKPCLLLLDEPTASLDPDVAEQIRTKIKEYVQKNNAGVLWTSHNMREIEEVCSEVMFLSRGKILLHGNPKTLPRDHHKKDLEELFIKVAREPLEIME